VIFHRLGVLQGLFGAFRGNPGARASAHSMGLRMTAIMARNPKFAVDIANLGGVFAAPPVQLVNGQPHAPTRDLYQCGRDEGRRELALQILALGGLTHEDLNQLMEDNYDD
jgi:hypothetical protein